MRDENVDEPAPSGGDVRTVTRAVEVEAGADEVWSAISDPEVRALWLDDDDAGARELRLDEIDDGQRLVWTWWRRDEEHRASRVEIVLAPTVGGTRVVVTETLASASIGAAGTPTCPAPGPVTLRAGDRWTYRLLGLELLLVAAGVLVR
jgi:Activator of Hsp90 ATPase homolog 1-like protein